MTIRSIGYWTSTGLIAFVLLSGGVAELFRLWGTVDGIVQLGYPPYLVAILGTWKTLGAIALLLPRLPRLKEWAYAGAFFDLTGAAISQAIAGDGASHVLWPSVFAACTLVSWALRPESRRLGSLLPGGPWHRPVRRTVSA